MSAVHCSTPFGCTIFCDDVRFEANGKQMYIGIYTEEMLLPAVFPTRLRSLSAVIQYHERPKESRDDIKFVLTYTGVESPVAELTVPRNDLDSFPLPPEDPNDSDHYDPILRLGVILTVNDLTLPGPGKFKVRAVRGDTTHRIGMLKVSQVNIDANNPTLAGLQPTN